MAVHDGREAPEVTNEDDARAIIDANAYLTLATADGAGTPWASPVWFAHDAYVRFVWVSRPDARHSRNVGVRADVGIVVFDSTVPMYAGQAVYVEATAGVVADAELDRLIGVFSQRSEAQGGRPWGVVDVAGDAPLRMYVARASAHYVLGPDDRRLRVTLGDSG
jgi:nitroimidazol reductase NimA-like FMN-containing flavoprotein (pyridoxamine 5'-phosphate oxidase superfamily)